MKTDSRPCPDCGNERCTCPIDGYWVGALLAALLCACSEQPPPPYSVYFGAGVTESDRDTFGASAADWNAAVGSVVFRISDEPRRGRCGIEVVVVDSRPADSPSESLNASGTCLMRTEYLRNALEPCIALHELGHRLLEGHVAGTVMDDYGCDYEPVVTPGLARRVRERWGL